jgi:peroxiredoxin Q/BCP
MVFEPKLPLVRAFQMHFVRSPGKSNPMADSKRSNRKPAPKTSAAKARSGNPAVRAEARAKTVQTPKVARPVASRPSRPKGPEIKPKLGHAHALTTGDKAPPFTLTTSDGGRTSLTALRKAAKEHHRGLIIFFFTQAGSKTCTVEAVDFAKAYPALQKAGYEVIGISPDNRADLAKFKAEHKLPYTLASDTGSKVARKFGAYGKTHKYAITATMPDQFHRIVPRADAPLRATFVLDAEGHIEQVVPAVQAKGHVDRLRKRLKLV